MTNSLSPFSGSPVSASIKLERSPSQPISKPATAPAPTKPATKSKPRKRVNTAEKRNQHNAIERQRRETLNGKFLSLARLLPSLASHRRPSKSAIVNGSIAHLTHQRDQRLLASRLLRQLCADRDALAKECNEWRAANGFPPKEAVSGWTDEMEEVCSVEKEVFGNFATMGGDDDDEQDSQDMGDMGDMSLDQAAAVAATLNSTGGLITPRSSTDIDPIQHGFKWQQAQLQAQQQQQQTQQTQAQMWSGSDFSFNLGNATASSLHSNGSLPFSAFMSDSSSPSSNHTGMPTPPTTGDFGGFTHTPSPRSTQSLDDAQAQQPVWTEQQLLFLQSVQQQQLQRNALPQLAQSNLNVNNVNSLQGFNPAMFNNSFVPPTGLASDAFTQSLIASAFPQQANVHVGSAPMQAQAQQQQQQQQQPSLHRAQSEHMEAWRKLAIGGMMQRGDAQPTVAELKNAIRAGMGLGMGMSGLWEQNSVKGF